MRKEQTQVICDECGEVNFVDNNRTPNGWFRLLTIKVRFRPNNYNQEILKDENIIDIKDETDPDFCCRSCLDIWLKKQIDKISKS